MANIASRKRINRRQCFGYSTTIDRNIRVQVLLPAASLTPAAWVYLPLLNR